jgi:hypothetical protein
MDAMIADAREWRCRYLCQACGLNSLCPAPPLSCPALAAWFNRSDLALKRSDRY